MKNTETSPGLGELIERGGIYYALPGHSVREILETLVAVTWAAVAHPAAPSVLTASVAATSVAITPAQDLLQAVLEREALMSTGIGHGIAVPHPRNPLVNKTEEQFAALAFLQNPIDWNALDGKPVDTVLLVVSSSAKSHLKTLSSITFFCQHEAFLKLLKERAPRETLTGFIKDTEQEWERTTL